MNSRSKSRQLALQVLYQSDVGIPHDPQGSFELVDESPSDERVRASFGAEPLAEPLNPPVKDAGLVAPPRLVRPGLLAGARS